MITTIEKDLAALTEAKEILANDIEEFKKAPKDISGLNQAAINYRQATLALHESGMKLTNELKKVAEHGASENSFAVEFVTRVQDRETIEKGRYELQTKIWDDFILPGLNAVEPEQKDIQALEKKMRASSQFLEKEAKKEYGKLKKSKKKLEETTALEIQLEENLKTLKQKHDQITNYFAKYKEARYYKWLKRYCTYLEAQQQFSNHVQQLLISEQWKSVLAKEPQQLPDISIL